MRGEGEEKCGCGGEARWVGRERLGRGSREIQGGMERYVNTLERGNDTHILLLPRLGRVVDQERIEGQRVGKDVVANVVAPDTETVERLRLAVPDSHLDRFEVRVHRHVDACLRRQLSRTKGEGSVMGGQEGADVPVMVPCTTVPFLSSTVTVSLLSFICLQRTHSSAPSTRDSASAHQLTRNLRTKSLGQLHVLPILHRSCPLLQPTAQRRADPSRLAFQPTVSPFLPLCPALFPLPSSPPLPLHLHHPSPRPRAHHRVHVGRS